MIILIKYKKMNFWINDICITIELI
jgi:hypothetical protein